MNEIIVYEMDVKVYLMTDVNVDSSHNTISSLIDKVLSVDENYVDFHNKNTYKNYSFNNFYPLEQDFVFKKGKIYNFKLRTVDKMLAQYVLKNIQNTYTSDIKVLGATMRVIPKKHIDKLFSITPMIFKFADGYWRTSNTVDDIERRISSNIIKKYNLYFNVKIDENFTIFTSIKFKNNKPLVSRYKNTILLGDKMELKVSNHPLSQELAYFALGTGLAEMNSRGFGFMNYIWMPKVS